MKILTQDKDEVLVNCEVLRKTDKAYLVSNPDGDNEEIWLPSSQIEVIDVISDLEYEISIPTWLAQEKEII